MAAFQFEPLSEDAVLLRLGTTIDRVTNARVHAATQALRDARLPGIIDIAPAYASLLVRFDPLGWSGGDQPALARIVDALRSALVDTAAGRTARDGDPARAPPSREPVRGGCSGRAVEVPVCYGDTFGPDLERVAAHAGIPQDEVVARHTGATYVVAMLGFAPGFPYLLGLDPVLHAPRRATPRTRVPAGSVAIGGAQTGIYPCLLPGGWQLIGRTPLALFRADHDPPALLAPGDAVRFRAIPADEFARVAAREGGADPASASGDVD